VTVALVLAAVAAGVGLWLWPLSHDSGMLVFTAAWLLMTVATMLPTTAPLLRAFTTVASARPRRPLLIAAVVAGFLGVWAAAGFGAGLLNLGAQGVLHRPGVHEHLGLLLGTVLVLAGAYQLSGLADRCLRRCRAPMGFLARHWTGGSDVVRQSLRIGAHYGRSCLGCCAGLMAVMLVVGMGSLAWMFLIGLTGALQKIAPWGRALTIPIAATLFGGAGVLVVGHAAG
jgi:predicted metal-binding membrane protein